MNILIAIIIVLAVIVYWRRKHLEYVEEIFILDLFKLRDKLRSYASDDKIPTNWVYTHLENSISVMVYDSYYITFFHLLIAMSYRKEDKETKAFSKILDAEIDKNDYFNEIREEYYYITEKYLINQHRFSIPVITFFSASKRILRNLLNWMRKSLLIIPETSYAQHQNRVA